MANPKNRGYWLERALMSLINFGKAASRHPSRTSKSIYAILRDFDELQAISDAQIRDISRHVVRRKYVIVRKSGAKFSIKVTPSAKIAVQRLSLQRLKLAHDSTWDGKWRIVLFDVPEEKKTARDAL